MFQVQIHCFRWRLSPDPKKKKEHINVFTNTLIYAALPEFYAILGLVGAIMAR